LDTSPPLGDAPAAAVTSPRGEASQWRSGKRARGAAPAPAPAPKRRAAAAPVQRVDGAAAFAPATAAPQREPPVRRGSGGGG